MRDAESTLDQLISFCGSRIVEADVLSMFGLTSRGQILSLTNAILNGQIEAALRDLNDLAKNGKDLGRLLSDLLGHFRNILIYQVSNGDLSLLEVTESEAQHLGSQGKVVSTEALTRIMEVLTECETRFKDAASKKILLEVAILKAIQARNVVGIDTVLAKLHELRNGGAASEISPLELAKPRNDAPPKTPVVPAPPVGSPRPPATIEKKEPALSVPSAPPVSPEVIKSAVPDEVLESLWGKLLEGVGKVKMFTKAYLEKGFPVSFEKGVFTVGFDPAEEHSRSLFDSPQNIALLETKLKEIEGGDVRLKITKAPWPPGRSITTLPTISTTNDLPKTAVSSSSLPAPTRPQARPEPAKESPATSVVSQEDFKNDPLIKKALEIFRGQIVEVRT